METDLINALGTIGFGGGGIAIVSYFWYLHAVNQSKIFETSLQRICESFDRAVDQRDKTIELLSNEIRIMRSGVHNG